MSNPFEFSDDPVPTADAIEKLHSLGEEGDTSRLTQFAQFIAGRLNSELVPQGFIMATILSVYDLQHGVNGFTGEPITGDLVGLKTKDYDELLRDIPTLAEAAFPESFANAVLHHAMKNGIMPAPEASTEPTLTDGEIITETIDNIDDAKRLIVDDAEERLAGLDWQEFGLEKRQIKEDFQVFTLMLRNAPYALPLTLMVDDRDHEAGLLRELLPHQKKLLHGKYWLAMVSDYISPEYAMATRDHIFLKGLEAIATLNQINPGRVAMHFARDVDGPVNRAGIRLYTFLEDHPELERKTDI